MKAAVLYTVFASLSFSGLNAYAQGTCATGGGNHAGGATPYQPPYLSNNLGTTNPSGTYPSAAEVSNFLNPGSMPAIANAASASAAAPVARVTVVDSASASTSPSTSSGIASNSATPAVRVTVVDDAPAVAPIAKTADIVNTVEPSEPKVSDVADSAPAASEESETIDAALKGLVGTWTAVARHGDGELTTVELQLDDRGWAELTVPGADGKPSTIKRRVELKNDELKLTGPDADLLLGKLVTFNSRQLVLDRSGGQVTFVRP